VKNAEGLGWGTDVDGAFCPPLGMVGNVFAWSSPVDQLVALDVAFVVLFFPCPPYILVYSMSY
jgi:hypothetical protein